MYQLSLQLTITIKTKSKIFNDVLPQLKDVKGTSQDNRRHEINVGFIHQKKLKARELRHKKVVCVL